MPAPAWMRTSTPSLRKALADAGVTATRFSPGTISVGTPTLRRGATGSAEEGASLKKVAGRGVGLRGPRQGTGSPHARSMQALTNPTTSPSPSALARHVDEHLEAAPE